MMVAEALTQCLGHCVKRDISTFTMEEAAEAIRAVNAGVATYYQLAPDIYKRTSASEDIPEPTALTGLSVAANSLENTGTAFSLADRGKTILLAGDPNFNEIVSATRLLRPYKGTGTSTTGTLYHDTISFFDASVERVVTDVRIVQDGRQYRLHRATEAMRSVIFPWATMSGFALAMGAWSPAQRSFASRPRLYSCLMVGDSIATGAGDARFMLRMDPIPTSSFAVEMEIDMLARAYKVDALDDGTQLPVQDQRAAAMLLPLIEYHLMATSIWKGTPEVNRLISDRYREAQAMTAALPTHLAPPKVRWGNKIGW